MITLPDLELVSAQVHQAWIESKLRNGITSRLFDQTGEELMVPYEQLTERAKDLDRITVQTIYTAIHSLQKD